MSILKSKQTTGAPQTVKDVMRVKEAAEYLRLHPMTIYRMCSLKKVPFFRMTENGSMRFRKTELDKWMASKTVVMKRHYV